MRFDLNDSIEEDLRRLSGSEFHRRGAAIKNAHDRDAFGLKRRAVRSPEHEGAYEVRRSITCGGERPFMAG